MDKSGLTNATIRNLRRVAQESVNPHEIEKEVTMTIINETEEASDYIEEHSDETEMEGEASGYSNEHISPDLSGAPWDEEWEVTDPLLKMPEDNTSRNMHDAKMVHRILVEE